MNSEILKDSHNTKNFPSQIDQTVNGGKRGNYTEKTNERPVSISHLSYLLFPPRTPSGFSADNHMYYSVLLLRTVYEAVRSVGPAPPVQRGHAQRLKRALSR